MSTGPDGEAKLGLLVEEYIGQLVVLGVGVRRVLRMKAVVAVSAIFAMVEEVRLCIKTPKLHKNLPGRTKTRDLVANAAKYLGGGENIRGRWNKPPPTPFSPE